jgi:hypothetical protein
LVAHRVIDDFEVVNVDEQHANDPTPLRCSRHGDLYPFLEQ